MIVIPRPKALTNRLSMKFMRIEPGEFSMGQADGDLDERSVHRVTISKPFYMASTCVTNAQYEKFDPSHRRFRGARGFSKDDDEAVVFVNWHHATAFCEWLSKKEKKPYRLPTEAEWEYACRAGTTTRFFTGDDLPGIYHKHQEAGKEPKPVSLKVTGSPPNPWGLYDMHGLVEEWCSDWYGPYEAHEQTDPVGRITGTFKVTRGGSHNATVDYLRSASRLGTLPEDKHWLIGFRVVLGEQPLTEPLPKPPEPLWAKNVSRQSFDWKISIQTAPYFEGPLPFVRWPETPENVPMYPHNHCPSITWCPNGDLLAVWFSAIKENGREMTILASRLRAGQNEWDLPSEFFKAPDRNMTGSSLFHDGKGRLYHFNGMEAAGGWNNLALVMRTSDDNGVTWATRLIQPDHQPGNQVISGTFMTKSGRLVQPCDAVPGSDGGTVLHWSDDSGKTWQHPNPSVNAIDGIHAGVAELKDGRLLAFGRLGKRVGWPSKDGGFKMPMSVSRDRGKTWDYSASPFPPINGGQRPVLMRLKEGPLFFASFTDSSKFMKNGQPPEGLPFPNGERAFGLFAAVSFDEGDSWPVKRLVTPGGPPREFDGEAWTGRFTMDYNHAEPKGYLAAVQTPDGIIHLVSSALHYRFNLAWLEAS